METTKDESDLQFQILSLAKKDTRGMDTRFRCQ